MFAGVPEEPVEVPSKVRGIAAGRDIAVVWKTGLGGLTLELVGPSDRWFVKWGPPSHRSLLEAESDRLRWASGFTPVPVPLDEGHDAEGAWLITDGLDGESAVTPEWLREPATA